MASELGSVEEVQALLAAIIASSDDAIISKDLNGVVQSWNQSAERIFGYTAEEMIGQPITILFPPDRLEEEPKILDQLRRGKRVDHFETVRVSKDGRQLDISVTISPVKDPTGRIVGVSKVARDITSIKRTTLEREQLLEREVAARSERNEGQSTILSFSSWSRRRNLARTIRCGRRGCQPGFLRRQCQDWHARRAVQHLRRQERDGHSRTGIKNCPLRWSSRPLVRGCGRC